MSQDETEDEPGAVKQALRTVTPASKGHRDAEMDAIGWTILVGLVVIMLPLLPVLVVVWVLSKVFGRLGRATD